MKNLKHLILTIFSASVPNFALAGGHSDFGGHGTSVITGSNIMEGSTGVLLSQTSEDVWIWDDAPEGYPTASTASCAQYIAFATGQMMPLGFINVCQQVDVDGDVNLLLATPQDDGSFLVNQIAGTGKWAAFTGANWVGRTDVSIGQNASVYSFSPK